MISFIPLSSPASEKDIHFLYKLLLSRKFNISHRKSPSIEDHRAFVLNHPYRNWYLIKFESDYIGTLYLSNENIIGIITIKMLFLVLLHLLIQIE